MVEDILDKNSSESCFIQACGFISCFIHIYFTHIYSMDHDQEKALPNRAANVIGPTFVSRVLAALKAGNKLNLKASRLAHLFGFAIYPK